MVGQITFFLHIVVLIATVGAVYDCRRDSKALCEFGKCNMISGKCENCQTGYEGYDCSIETDKIGIRCPENRCQNGGTCHNRVCTCTEDWTGNRCQRRRYALNCNYDEQRMTMTVRPHIENFSGKVYISNKGDIDDCNFNKVGNRLPLQLLHTDETCGPTVNEETERKRYVIIQFDPTKQTPYDEYVEFVCGVSGVLEELTFEIKVGDITGVLIQVTKSLSPLVGDIKMRITLGESEEAVASVDVNTQLYVYLVLSEEGDVKFNSIRLVNCIASNSPTGSEGYREAKFIYNSCPHTDLDNVMNPTIYNGGNDAGFSFYALKFIDSDDLYITCDVKTCEDKAGCEPVSCEEGKKRRRRESGEELQTVHGKVQINDPGLGFSGLRQGAQEMSPICYQTDDMKATLVALSVVLGIGLLVCIVIVIVRIIGRTKRAS